MPDMSDPADLPPVPEQVWRDLAFRTQMEEYRRAEMLAALGVDLDTYCRANKHRWVDYVDLQPVPGTDHLEPYCRGCEEGRPGPFGD